jgi:hypothetical protein
MDTDGLKALQTLGDASHFSIFSRLRKEILRSVKLMASSADPWCARALCSRLAVPGHLYGMGIGGVCGANFLYI